MNVNFCKFRRTGSNPTCVHQFGQLCRQARRGDRRTGTMGSTPKLSTNLDEFRASELVVEVHR